MRKAAPVWRGLSLYTNLTWPRRTTGALQRVIPEGEIYWILKMDGPYGLVKSIIQVTKITRR